MVGGCSHGLIVGLRAFHEELRAISLREKVFVRSPPVKHTAPSRQSYFLCTRHSVQEFAHWIKFVAEGF